MNAEQLLAIYDRFAEAPDAVKRLRRFVLDLAVRGKLVEQNPDDEPASALLEKIAAEKADMVKAGEVKRLKPPQISELSCVDFPAGWAFAPLGKIIASHVGGGTPSKSNHSYWNGDISWASVKDIGKSKYLDSTIDSITQSGLENSSSNLVSPGSLLVVTRMGLGKVSINRIAVAINQDLRALILPDSMSADYCYIFFQTCALEGTGLTVKGIKIKDLLSIPLPVPPLAEQHRIVAKVDELMALCDRLEATRNTREATRDKLTTASLSRLTAADTDEPTFQSHAHFALDTLPALTTRPDQIKAMRQTILDLAVRGKLVEQDPTDEPASELLARITEEKAQLANAGKIRRTKAPPSLLDSDLPFKLPLGWVWSQIAGVGVVSPRNNAESDRLASFVPMPLIASEYGVAHQHEIREWGDIKTGYTHFAEGDVAVAKITPCFENGKSTMFRNLTGGIGAGTTELHVVRPLILNAQYILLFLSTPYFIETGIGKMTGTAGQKRVPKEYFANSPFPLPPLAEQHRIVAKVDELIALCDQLETSLTRAETTRSRLLESALHEALKPATEEPEPAEIEYQFS